jgi:hypothetical protein
MNKEHLIGLQLALENCTKYEDRMYLQFLIKVIERNNKE